MQGRSLGAAFVAVLLASAPAAAAEAYGPADPDSPIGRAGSVILEAVAGRSYAEAFARTQSPSNAFHIDLSAVARAAGVASVGDALAGAPASEGQLSILPQFNTPEARFGASLATPPIIPFAVMSEGACLGGYVTGYPVADRVYSIDMAGGDCSAAAIERKLAGRYPLPVDSASAAAAESVAAAKSANAAAIAMQAGAATGEKGDAGTDLAPPGSVVDRVGQAILAAVAGRTPEQALDQGGSIGNPFGLESDPLLLAAGVYFVSRAGPGVAIDTSEFSIVAGDLTPGGKFDASDRTPPIIPFAFNRGGVCQGGYVTGYPVPDRVYVVDLKEKVCNAATIEDLVAERYARIVANPSGAPSGGMPATNGVPFESGDKAKPGPSEGNAPSTPKEVMTGPPTAPGGNALFDGVHATDHDLEMIAYAAYSGAYSRALRNENYFNNRDLSYAELRRAIRASLEKAGYDAAEVATAPMPSAEAAKACAADGRIHLRVAFNGGGTGVSLVAVSASRMSAYEYFPLQSPDLRITHADACLGHDGPSASRSEDRDRLTRPAR